MTSPTTTDPSPGPAAAAPVTGATAVLPASGAAPAAGPVAAGPVAAEPATSADRESARESTREPADGERARDPLREARVPAGAPAGALAGDPAAEALPEALPEAPPLGAIRSFHARQGRLSPARRETIERLRGRNGLDLRDLAERQILDAGDLFGRTAPVVVEIGFGMGDATLAMAAADPGTDILAVDVHKPGIARLMADAHERGLTNIRVVSGDAVTMLRDHIAPDSLAGIRVYFPDPWPKKKHTKRRLVQAPFAALAASRLAPGGTLHCATDWAPYARWMLAVLDAEPLLENTAGTGYLPRPAWRPLTHFERRGIEKGHEVADLLHRRVGPAEGT